MVLHADSKKIVFTHRDLRLVMGSSQCTGLWGTLKTGWDITQQDLEGNGPAIFLEKLCDSGRLQDPADCLVLIYKMKKLHIATIALILVFRFSGDKMWLETQKIHSPK